MSAQARLLAAARALYPVISRCPDVSAEVQGELEAAIKEAESAVALVPGPRVRVVLPKDVESVEGDSRGVLVLLVDSGEALALHPEVAQWIGNEVRR